MIRGRVTADREALLRLAVKGGDSETREIEGVIDTGFNGFLTLPGSAVHALGLPMRWFLRKLRRTAPMGGEDHPRSCETRHLGANRAH